MHAVALEGGFGRLLFATSARLIDAGSAAWEPCLAITGNRLAPQCLGRKSGPDWSRWKHGTRVSRGTTGSQSRSGQSVPASTDQRRPHRGGRSSRRTNYRDGVMYAAPATLLQTRGRSGPSTAVSRETASAICGCSIAIEEGDVRQPYAGLRPSAGSVAALTASVVLRPRLCGQHQNSGEGSHLVGRERQHEDPGPGLGPGARAEGCLSRAPNGLRTARRRLAVTPTSAPSVMTRPCVVDLPTIWVSTPATSHQNSGH